MHTERLSARITNNIERLPGLVMSYCEINFKFLKRKEPIAEIQKGVEIL